MAAELGLARKAHDVVLLDLRGVTPRPEVDFFVIMSSFSEPHQRALADHILETLDKRGIRSLHLEGYPASGWILIDLVDVVVHIFRPDSRDFYALETLWGDAASERIEDDGGAPAVPRPAEPRKRARPAGAPPPAAKPRAASATRRAAGPAGERVRPAPGRKRPGTRKPRP